MPEGYAASVAVEGNVATITNTHTPKKGATPVLPKTDDPMSMALIGMTGLVATAILGVGLAIRKYERSI